MNNKTIYISGKMTDNPMYQDDFANAVLKLKEEGYTHIINPCCLSVLNLHYEQYMAIDYAMIDVSDEVYFLSNWEESHGAQREYMYAVIKNKKLRFEKKEGKMC